jgi:hypothetical protein
MKRFLCPVPNSIRKTRPNSIRRTKRMLHDDGSKQAADNQSTTKMEVTLD